MDSSTKNSYQLEGYHILPVRMREPVDEIYRLEKEIDRILEDNEEIIIQTGATYTSYGYSVDAQARIDEVKENQNRVIGMKKRKMVIRNVLAAMADQDREYLPQVLKLERILAMKEIEMVKKQLQNFDDAWSPETMQLFLTEYPQWTSAFTKVNKDDAEIDEMSEKLSSTPKKRNKKKNANKKKKKGNCSR